MKPSRLDDRVHRINLNSSDPDVAGNSALALATAEGVQDICASTSERSPEGMVCHQVEQALHDGRALTRQQVCETCVLEALQKVRPGFTRQSELRSAADPAL